MKCFEHPDKEPEPRTHPWLYALSNPDHRYYDFKTEPGLIRTTLEDFVPLNHWPAIQTFYGLLEWLNGADSVLESNDCAMRPPGPNKSPHYPKHFQCGARLMLFFRHLAHNTNAGTMKWLEDATLHHLKQIDPAFAWGVVGTTLQPTIYATLPGTEEQQTGALLMLTFWAWGDTHDEAMENLDRVFTNTREALQYVSAEINQA